MASTATRTASCPSTAPESGAARPRGPCRCRRSGRRDAAASAGGTAGTRSTAGIDRVCVARRLSRRDFEVFRFGTAIAAVEYSDSARRQPVEPVLELGELRPSAGRGLALVLVRLPVEVAPAHRAEAGAVVAAEDLVRQRERDRVVGPGREVEPVLDEVRRRAARPTPPGSSPGTRGSSPAATTPASRQAAHAGATIRASSSSSKHEPGARLRERDHGLGALRDGDIPLPAEVERLEVHAAHVPELLAGAQLDACGR